VLYVTDGFWEVEEAGVPPVIVQCQDVGPLVELSVRVIGCPTQSLVEEVKLATGGTLADAK
jgi:hypothetical protein